MFKVIDKNGKECGPLGEEELRSWITQGRLDGQCLAKPDGASEWKPLREFSEFRVALGSVPGSAPAPLSPSPDLQLLTSPKLSGLAITSLVLGILGPFTLGITAIPALVLGIVALVKIQKNRPRLSGTGLAIGGICLAGIVMLMLPIMAAMLLPALAKAKSKAQNIQCMNNIKQLNLALIMYAGDHGDRLPPADEWCDLIRPYTGGSMAMYHCPAQFGGRCSYAFNASLGNRKMGELGSPSQAVLIFSSVEGWNQSGGMEIATAHSHSIGLLSLGFADGHAEITRAARLRSAVWEPPPAQPQ